MRFSFILREAGSGIRRHLGTFVAIVVTTAIALTMFGGSLMLRAQIDELKGYWYDKTEVSVFINKDATSEAVDVLGEQLKANPLVDTVYYESQQEAYQHFSHQFRRSPSLVRQVTPDQLPRSYRVALDDPKQGEALAQSLAGNTTIRQVVDEHAQLATLFRVLTGFQNAALLLAAVQALAAIVLVGNMLRSAVVVRRRELSIGRLMGANRRQLALPFFVEVAAAGTAGLGLATGLIALGKWQLIDNRLSNSNVLTGVVGYIGWDALWAALPWLALAGVGLPLLVAAGVLRRHLRD